MEKAIKERRLSEVRALEEKLYYDWHIGSLWTFEKILWCR